VDLKVNTTFSEEHAVATFNPEDGGNVFHVHPSRWYPHTSTRSVATRKSICFLFVNLYGGPWEVQGRLRIQNDESTNVIKTG
jgi:hypothetical protein